MGIKIPLDLADIERINFGELATQTLSQLKQLHALSFSWWDKLSLVKSFLFPKFLYLFRTIPILLSSTQLHKWQQMFDQFIWDYKKPRIAFSNLIRPSRSGVLDYPDLQSYYQASLLSMLSKMLDTHDTLDWIYIESYYVTPNTLQETIWSLPTYRQSPSETNPFLNATLKIWDLTHRRLVNLTSLLSTYLRQHWFAPALRAPSFHVWKTSGLSRLIDIIKHGKILDKATLERQNVCKLPWFQYLQLTHLISHLQSTKRLTSSLTTFESLLYQGTIGMKGLISNIYKSLLHNNTNCLPSYVASWNREDLFTLDDSQWEQIWASHINRSQFLNVRIQFF